METSYRDAFRSDREVGPDVLIGVLGALGISVGDERGAAARLEEEDRDSELPAGSAAPPSMPEVLVAWDGEIDHGPPLGSSGVAMQTALVFEDGSEAIDAVRVDAAGSRLRLRTPVQLPYGVHVLRMTASPSGDPLLTTVISAPRTPPVLAAGSWGLFAPTYGLVDERMLPCGDLTALERLAQFTGRLGGQYVATLPLLASFSRDERPDCPLSPYSPLSRMWWDEGYLDPSRSPELASALERLGAPDPAGSPLAGVSTASGVADPTARAARLRPALAVAAHRMKEVGGGELEGMRRFVGDRPGVMTYARFRAAAEARGTDRSSWPAAWQRGEIADGEVDPDAVAAHVLAQHLVDEQLGDIAHQARRSGVRLILDLPIGCQADGFDPWAYPGSFASGATVGAPPDLFFSAGQDWGFRPLHPAGERAGGYEVLRASLANLLRHAGGLRIDHAMGLARLWWIPDGADAKDGAYVRYQAEELIALCCLEAWRADAVLIGEDLGTVEDSLRDALSDHGIAGMHVAVFDLEAPDAHPLEPLHPREGSVALVDTHDTATFAGWFLGADIGDRRQLGLIDDTAAATEHVRRARARRCLVDRLVAAGRLSEDETSSATAVYAGLVEELAESAAGLVLVTLEDLLGETDPQNIPGTTTEHANFCRPVSRPLQEIEADEALVNVLTRVERGRQVAAEQVAERAPAPRAVRTQIRHPER